MFSILTTEPIFPFPFGDGIFKNQNDFVYFFRHSNYEGEKPWEQDTPLSTVLPCRGRNPY